MPDSLAFASLVSANEPIKELDQKDGYRRCKMAAGGYNADGHGWLQTGGPVAAEGSDQAPLAPSPLRVEFDTLKQRASVRSHGGLADFLTCPSDSAGLTAVALREHVFHGAGDETPRAILSRAAVLCS